MERKIGVGAAPASNEVVFCCADGAFCCVAAMVVWRYQLVVNFLFVQIVFENVAAFIV